MPTTQAKTDRLREQIHRLRTLLSDHKELALRHLERLGRQCESPPQAQARDIRGADSRNTIGLRNLDAFTQVLTKYHEAEKSGEALDNPIESMIHDLIGASFTEGSAWDIVHTRHAEADPVGDELTPSLTADPVFQCITSRGQRKRAKSAPCLLEPTPDSTARSSESPWSAEWHAIAHRGTDTYVTIDDDVLWCELNGMNAKVEDLDLYWPEYGRKMDVVRKKVMRQIYEEGLVSAREM